MFEVFFARSHFSLTSLPFADGHKQTVTDFLQISSRNRHPFFRLIFLRVYSLVPQITRVITKELVLYPVYPPNTNVTRSPEVEVTYRALSRYG